MSLCEEASHTLSGYYLFLSYT